MAYVASMVIALLLMLCDVFLTALRSTLRTGGDVAMYVLLSIHEVVTISEGVIVFAFFSYTIWFTAGLLGHLTFTLRATLPLFFLRLFFVQMPLIYGKFLSGTSRNWDDPIYGILFCGDILSCIAMCVSLTYTVACLSERRMYAPYHTEWRPVGFAEGTHLGAAGPLETQQSVALSSRGGTPHP
jgi:hypothetical protein